MSAQEEAVTKADLKDLQKDLNLFKEEIVHEFHVVSEGLGDQIKLVAEGHAGLVKRLDRLEKENERQHQETRSLIKLSFSELDRRISTLESEVKDLQEWRRQIDSRHQA
jgi:ABC-type oligopeptide transport system ATPase subunit